jgi:hypothetical protein
MSYKPSFSQSLTLDGLKRWISSELVRISNALVTSTQKTKLEVATAEPAKPQTGEVVLADGTDWNPSNGRGLYYYDAGWQQVGSGGSGTEVNDLTTSVTWANVPDANINASSVTQHQSALSITESQISDLGTYLTSHQDISGKVNKSGDTFTGDVSVSGTNNLDVGQNHSVTGDRNVVNGYDNTVSGINNNVSGQDNTVNGDVSLVTGYANVTGSSGDRGITAGYNNYNYSENSIIVGNSNNTSSTGHNSIVGGYNNSASGNHCLAVGYQCQVGGPTKWFSTGLGYQTQSLGTASFTGGRSTYDGLVKYTQVDADAGFAFGTGNHVFANAPSSIALGTLTHCGESSPSSGVTAAQSMAIGYRSKAYKDNSFAGGNQSYSFGDTSFSFGNGAVASNGFSNIALGRGITTPVSGGIATTIGAVSVGQFNEYAVTTDQHFSVGTGTTDGSRYTSMYVGPRSSANSGIVMKALKDSAGYSSDSSAATGGVPLGGLYRTSSGYIKVRIA